MKGLSKYIINSIREHLSTPDDLGQFILVSKSFMKRYKVMDELNLEMANAKKNYFIGPRSLIDRLSLSYVKYQSVKICLKYVKRNPWDLKYVKNQTPEICIAALEENPHVIIHVKNITKEMQDICDEYHGSLF
jgi:hypothetical protein